MGEKKKKKSSSVISVPNEKNESGNRIANILWLENYLPTSLQLNFDSSTEAVQCLFVVSNVWTEACLPDGGYKSPSACRVLQLHLDNPSRRAQQRHVVCCSHAGSRGCIACSAAGGAMIGGSCSVGSCISRQVIYMSLTKGQTGTISFLKSS